MKLQKRNTKATESSDELYNYSVRHLSTQVNIILLDFELQIILFLFILIKAIVSDTMQTPYVVNVSMWGQTQRCNH